MPFNYWIPNRVKLLQDIEQEEKKLQELQQPPWSWLSSLGQRYWQMIGGVQKAIEAPEEYYFKPMAQEALFPTFKPPEYEQYVEERKGEMAGALGVEPEMIERLKIGGLAQGIPWYAGMTMGKGEPTPALPGGELREIYEKPETFPKYVRGATELGMALPYYMLGWRAFGATGAGKVADAALNRAFRWLFKVPIAKYTKMKTGFTPQQIESMQQVFKSYEAGMEAGAWQNIFQSNTVRYDVLKRVAQLYPKNPEAALAQFNAFAKTDPEFVRAIQGHIQRQSALKLPGATQAVTSFSRYAETMPVAGGLPRATPSAQLPVVTGMATDSQKVTAHRIAWNKGLINPVTQKVTQGYRRLANRLVGKSSMLKMTQEEADYFIEGLNRLVRTPSGKVRIPTGQALLPKQLADKIPMLKDVGILEKVRPAWRVWSKIGLWEEVWEPVQYAEAMIVGERATFEKTITGIERLIGKDIDSRARVFQALEGELAVTELNVSEAKAYKWFKDYFDKTADELKLPLAKRRQNYVTHIFEKRMEQDLRTSGWLDPEFVGAIDWITPKTVFNPYLRERLGKEIGLVSDPFRAARAYEYRFLRTKYYDPLVKKLRAYRRILPGNAGNYLRDYLARMTNMPLRGDLEYNQTMREFGDVIAKLPGGDKLAQYFKQGNSAGLMAYHYVNMLYFLWLGWRPSSAIRNLSQQVLALAEVGPIHFFKGVVSPTTRVAVKDSLVLKGRQRAYLPGTDTAFADRWSTKMREASMKMFRGADRINVTNSFKAGFHEAESLGLPYEWCVKRGDEVAARTQYVYTKMGGAAWSQTALGRMLSPLTTWPINFLELMNQWIRGKPSQVYLAYEAATGNKVKPRMAWDKARKALIIYLTILGLSYAVEKKTRIKATQYTGWTSFRYLADMLSGELAGLELPGIIAQLAAGAVTQDSRMLKEAWGRLKRFRPNIEKQIERILSGATDWLSLFFYMNPEKEEGKPTLPGGFTPEPFKPEPFKPK